MDSVLSTAVLEPLRYISVVGADKSCLRVSFKALKPRRHNHHAILLTFTAQQVYRRRAAPFPRKTTGLLKRASRPRPRLPPSRHYDRHHDRHYDRHHDQRRALMVNGLKVRERHNQILGLDVAIVSTFNGRVGGPRGQSGRRFSKGGKRF